ncbi:hypothetical protein F9L16_00700 [Agarivorans sp. B2Z047]|uniref:hypothetical protein n=1 Tax=Agarivorans sp. B2Z047 TaxID=2652721 RepID=UPI00128B0217|nr:hypothetical protein [Agarivorans sp. B2Z047]MPW27526.1 hypothetical protein [Agarivorans sp. B2Z047]UQN44633.1 hypothetical protein LQZ07_09255 [Agarivorans sp. B2Z047]
MLKKFLSYVSIGLSIGIGLAGSLFLVVFLSHEYFSPSPENFALEQDGRQVETLKAIIKSLPESDADLCKNIQGVWYGSRESNDGAYIDSWEVEYKPNGEFIGTFISKSIAAETSENQKGTWTCNKSILMNDLMIDGERFRFNYLLLHVGDDQRTYVHIGPYELEEVFISYRKRNI